MFKIILIGYLLIGTVYMIITTIIYRFDTKGINVSDRLFIISRLYLLFLWPIEWCVLYLWISGHAGINESIEIGSEALKQSGDLTDEEDS